MKEGLMESAETTAAGYQLFDPEMAERVKRIRSLQSERRTLAEIRQELNLNSAVGIGKLVLKT